MQPQAVAPIFSLSVPAPDSGFSVYRPAMVQVQVIRNHGDLTTPASTTTDPNPVFAELQLAGPPPKARKVMRPKKPKQPKSAAAPAPANSVFPDPNAPPPPAGAASR